MQDVKVTEKGKLLHNVDFTQRVQVNNADNRRINNPVSDCLRTKAEYEKSRRSTFGTIKSTVVWDMITKQNVTIYYDSDIIK